MASIKANVTPELLSWARRSAGYTLEEAAKKINNMRADKLAAWEKGPDRPTVKQLYKLAEVYKRPVGTFFLSELPQDFTIPRDFRRLPGEVAGVYSPALRRQIRLAEERRGTALELFEDIGEEPPAFPLVAALDNDPDEVASRIREALGVDSAQQFSWRDPRRYKPFRQWRKRIENIGVLVFQATRVETQEMLGFSLAEPVLPVIAVNRKIHLNGRIFTLLHEFVHLMLRQSSICDIDEEVLRPPEEQRIEVFCNRVAGAALVPTGILVREEIVAARPAARREWDEEDIKALALRFSVSREVIVRRLLIAGRTTEEFYRRKRREYFQPPEAGDEEKAGGPENPAVRALSTLGASFLTLILESHNQGHLTLSQVSGLIGERVKWVPEIERRMSV
jgi:Zn-dependent peptidase ImmA (M78 family)/DNA-binding XRE family transcriptional regulator